MNARRIALSISRSSRAKISSRVMGIAQLPTIARSGGVAGADAARRGSARLRLLSSRSCALLVTACLALIGCQAGPTPVTGHDIKGTFEFAYLGSCVGVGGFADIHAGLAVTLTDQAGAILGATVLDAGQRITPNPNTCTFSYDFGQVAAGATFYSVEVGKRGKVTESAAMLEADGWTFGTLLNGG